MESKFLWLLIVAYVLAVTYAAPVRTRRDLARIQNIIKWLLGISERNLPLIENEHRRLYTIPAYQKLLFRALPQMEINDNIGHVLTEGFYHRKPYMPVQTTRNNYPFVYSSYSPLMQEYTRLRDRDYGYGRPMYPINQVPMYQEPETPLCPISVTNLDACDYGTGAIITETSHPLPQPPMYIQNRMREITLGHAIPPVNFQQDTDMPPTGLDDAAVNEINEAISTKTEQQLIPILSLTKPVVDAQRQITKSNIDMRNKVTFTAPVHSKYKYKMIYHNQPEKNTAVEMNSILIPKSIEGISTPLVNEAFSTENPFKRQEQLRPIHSLTKPEAVQRLITKSDIDTKNIVTFSAPAPSKYEYKMIYHNQHENNNAVEMGSVLTAKQKEVISTPSINEAIPTENPFKREEQLTSTLSLIKPEADPQRLTTKLNIDTKNKVTFAAPVHSKYKYKMIYHNQPEKNTAIEVDSILTPEPKEDIWTSIDPVSDMLNKANSNHVPPANIEESQDNTNNVKFDDYNAVASESRSMFALTETPYTNAANRDKPSRVVVRRRKLDLSRPEYGRGDIPETSLQ